MGSFSPPRVKRAIELDVPEAVAFAAVDSIARRKFRQYLLGIAVLAVILGLLAGLVSAFVADWRIAVTVPIGIVVVVLLVVNVRDLVRR